jgi:hypothetical protein
MTPMHRFLTAIFMLLVVTRILCAEPLDRRQLPPGTAWVVHFDVEAARSSSLVHAMYANWSNQPQVRQAIEKARAATGMDLTREIRSLTLYGLAYSPDQTVLIVRGKVDRPRLEELLKKIPGYRRETLEGYEVHFWTEVAGRGAGKTSRAGAFVRDDTIAISPDAKTLIVALNVLEEKTASLSADSPLVMEAPEGAILQAAAVGFAEARNLPIQSPILRQCESGAISLGQRDETVIFHGKLVTRSPDVAAQLKIAVDAWRALAMRNVTNTPGAALLQSTALLEALKLEQNDKTIEVDWRLPATKLAKIVHVTGPDQPAESVKDKTP